MPNQNRIAHRATPPAVPLSQCKNKGLPQTQRKSIRALTNAKLHHVFKLKKHLRTGGLIIFSASIELYNRITRIISKKINSFINRRIADQHKLLSGHERFDSAESAWLLNLALMRDAERSANLTPEQKKQIRFLTSNYLHKAAPIHLKTMRLFSQKLGSLFQVSGLSTNKDYYHRFSLERQINLGKKFNKNLALGCKSPLISTDTIEFQHLLPLRFQVIDSHTPTSGDLQSTLKNHFSLRNPKEALNKPLSTPFLFDLTAHLQDDIEINGNKQKEIDFKDKYQLFKNELNTAIDNSVNELIKEHPELRKERRRLRKFIEKQMTCICRIDVDHARGMKVLPLYADITSPRVLKVHHDLCEFIVASGIGIGAIGLRREMVDGLNERRDVRYAGPKAKAGVKYFSNKLDFTNTAVYQRLATSFGAQVEPFQTHSKSVDQSLQINLIKKRLQNKPHMQLLGKATLNLLHGVLENISVEKWEELHSNEAYLQITQNILYKIREHLATAELHLDNYAEFAQQMELINAEIANLLEITQPFSEGDFATIYKNSLFAREPMSLLPSDLQAQFQIGLSKTSVNTFAGINAAVLQTNPKPQRVYSPGFYFEQAAFIGYDRSFESVMDDPQAQKIDLYCGQFNSNIEVEKNFTHYNRRDIAKDVREMIDKDKAANHLTVAIDCTIDNYNSENVKNLLETFKLEIDSGRLNFVFFRSGQKMDMLGMDNYYGSPYYIVNNGSSQWKSFTSLATNPVHKTDSLSLQWFSLSNKYIADSLEEYRNLIFSNTRFILDNIPAKLKPGAKTSKDLRVNTVAPDMKPAFIDIKVLGQGHKIKSAIIIGKFYEKLLSKGIKLQTRGTFGLYHPNALIITVNEIKGVSSIRLHPGLNPEENAAFIEFLNELADDISDEST